jgi:hypothetical protein
MEDILTAKMEERITAKSKKSKKEGKRVKEHSPARAGDTILTTESDFRPAKGHFTPANFRFATANFTFTPANFRFAPANFTFAAAIDCT